MLQKKNSMAICDDVVDNWHNSPWPTGWSAVIVCRGTDRRHFLRWHMDVLQSEGFHLAKNAYASFSKKCLLGDRISKKLTRLYRDVMRAMMCLAKPMSIITFNSFLWLHYFVTGLLKVHKAHIERLLPWTCFFGDDPIPETAAAGGCACGRPLQVPFFGCIILARITFSIALCCQRAISLKLWRSYNPTPLLVFFRRCFIYYRPIASP